MRPDKTPRQRPVVTISDKEWQHIETVYDLSPQQVEIVQAFVDGYSRPVDIAKAIGTTANCIEGQIERLYKKMDAHSRAEVMYMILAEVMAMRGSASPR